MATQSTALPPLGFGTMEYVDGSAEPSALYDATLRALKAGYRLLDCAEMYESTAHVGRAIKDSEVQRGDLFITTKLKGLPAGDYDGVKSRALAHLQLLGIDKCDLLLVHWPGNEDTDLANASSIEQGCAWSVYTSNIVAAWQNMLKLKEDGVCTHVGVSNFYGAHLKELAGKFPNDLPWANEVFIDACHQERKLVQQMKEQGIRVLAYRPLAFSAHYAMAADMGDATSAVLDAKAKEAGAASAQQLILAATVARGISVVVKSRDSDRLAQNLAAVELATKLSGDEIKEVDGAEMIDMIGATDETAQSLKQIACSAE